MDGGEAVEREGWRGGELGTKKKIIGRVIYIFWKNYRSFDRKF